MMVDFLIFWVGGWGSEAWITNFSCKNIDFLSLGNSQWRYHETTSDEENKIQNHGILYVGALWPAPAGQLSAGL